MIGKSNRVNTRLITIDSKACRLVKGSLISINGPKNDIIQVGNNLNLGFGYKSDSFQITSKGRFKVRSVLIADSFACLILLSKGLYNSRSHPIIKDLIYEIYIFI